MVEYVENAQAVYPDFKAEPALVLPYIDPWTDAPMLFERRGDALPFCRVRYLTPEDTRKGFVKRKALRYGQPAQSGCFPFFPVVPGLDWAAIAEDPEQPIIITEGEKKALAGCLAGFNVVGLGGVYNFLRYGKLLPHLERITWEGREVYLCFDSDAEANPDIQAAEERLASELATQRRARIFLVRLPQGDDGAKVGLDDFLVQNGVEAFENVLSAGTPMRRMDEMILELNNHVAWIEQEGLLLDLSTNSFLSSTSFTRGSKYSSIHTFATGAKGTVKKVSIAPVWLTHPLARRYAQVAFRPDTDEAVVPGDMGGSAYNLWRGWERAKGDITPFLELTDHLFQNMPEDQQELPLKWVIHKAQNPGAKIPLALVLVGPEGSGKSLWAACVREAFGRYGVELDGEALGDSFNGWVERTLLAVVDEVDPASLARNKARLRGYISRKRVNLNEKFRTARQVDSYTHYILTANPREVGSYGATDRRMIVVDCPAHRPDSAFYDRIVAWKEDGGPAKLLGWMLDYDLQGWVPPQRAPMTPEKYMAYVEGLTPVQRLAEEMRTGDHQLVVTWLDSMQAWAQSAEVGNDPRMARTAQDIMAAVGSIQVRPWYTPEELAMMFPMITQQLLGQKNNGATASGLLSRQLRDAGVTYLRNADDPRGFRVNGRICQYLVIAEPEHWMQPLTQNEFSRLMKQYPRYKDLQRRG